MPRDFPSIPTTTRPDLSTPSLPGLAWLLRHPKEWPQHFRWEFGNVLREAPCGTAGCAIGIAHLVWGGMFGPGLESHGRRARSSSEILNLTSAQVKLGMEEGDFEDIFLTCGLYDVALSIYVTPTMVADAIDAYLQRVGQ